MSDPAPRPRPPSRVAAFVRGPLTRAAIVAFVAMGMIPGSLTRGDGWSAFAVLLIAYATGTTWTLLRALEALSSWNGRALFDLPVWNREDPGEFLGGEWAVEVFTHVGVLALVVRVLS